MKKHVKQIYEELNNILIHVIVPSAGVGRRMKSYGCKSLLNIQGKKLIDIQVKAIEDCIPEHEIILIAGFDAERLMNSSPDHIIKIENEKYYACSYCDKNIESIHDLKHNIISETIYRRYTMSG